MAMTPGRFVRQQLEGVVSVTMLAKDDTTWLMGITFDDGRRVMAIVYRPIGPDDLWEVELGDEALGTGFDPKRDGCIEDQSPSPLERLLKGDSK